MSRSGGAGGGDNHGGDLRSGVLTATLALAISTTTWFLMSRRSLDASSATTTSRRRRAALEEDGQYAIPPVDPSAKLRTRGRESLRPVLPYVGAFFKCLQDPCDLESNPHGHIALCVAENKLVTDLLKAKWTEMAASPDSMGFRQNVVYGYSNFLGLEPLREAHAYFLARHFLFPERKRQSSSSSPLPAPLTPQEAWQHIDPDHIAISAGCAAVLNYLFFVLADRGDAVLVPAPYYAAFENDMRALAGLVPIPVPMTNPIAGPTPEDLNRAYEQAQSEGLRVGMLLITNPHNPLGVIYKPDTMKSIVAWARSKELHTIVDEIYALSIHQENATFESIIRTLDNNLGQDVHQVWALSKDFGASGFRVGMLYTQNTGLLNAMSNLNIFSLVSHPMQLLSAELLTDDDFCDGFLAEAARRLRTSYDICTRKLQEMVIPYVPAEAGLFVYCDFSALLPSATFEGEQRFATLVSEVAKVVLTPGQSQRDTKPGMFRICYAWLPPEILEVGLERLSRLVGKVRKLDWEDLHASKLRDVVEFTTVRRTASSLSYTSS